VKNNKHGLHYASNYQSYRSQMKHNTCTDYGKKVLVQTNNQIGKSVNNQTSALDSGTFSPKYWNI